MKIEITSDGNGAWNLMAIGDDDPMPMYAAYGRSPWAIKALVHGILTDHAEPCAQNARLAAESKEIS